MFAKGRRFDKAASFEQTNKTFCPQNLIGQMPFPEQQPQTHQVFAAVKFKFACLNGGASSI